MNESVNNGDANGGDANGRTGFNAWNPGISSKIPMSLEPQITLFNSENSTVDYRNAKELSDYCGLSTAEVISFRAQRLVTHELLVRVTADLSVPDGPNYEDLGISLRSMVHTIFEHYASPQINNIQKELNQKLDVARAFIEKQLSEQLFERDKQSQVTAPKRSFFDRWLKPKTTGKKTRPSSSEPPEIKALASWRKMYDAESDSPTRACLTSLIKIVGSIAAHRGRVMNDPELIATIATNHASNDIGQELVSELVAPLFSEAVEKEGYHRLPVQPKPVVMNVKGSSASGKSTIRPQQRELADKLDIPWEEFALISPDYWRKYLLDYDSLGDDYKYAAMLTGQELEIIDKKLDRYMARKAADGHIPHLLIDRFRFDSFNIDDGQNPDSKLLSRFGDRVFMFFMITPPSETVERAWLRGLSTGRFKAVDDLLFHNIEAFTGMPALFLSWVKSKDKQVHFEFLNNDVPKGTLPETAAFGWNDSMTILDYSLMRDVDRYRKVEVDARSADQVLITDDKENSNTEFLANCIKAISHVKFADAGTAKVYAEFENNKLSWVDKELLARQTCAELFNGLINRFGYSMADCAHGTGRSIDFELEKKYTLGQWSAPTTST